MSKIIDFKSKSDSALGFLEEIADVMKDNNLDSFIFVSKNKADNNIFVGYCNLSIGERQELLGHLQLDIIKRMIEENYIID